MRICSIFVTVVALLLSLTGIATTTAGQVTGSVTGSLAPGGASLTSTSGTWTWGPATAASLDCPGCYQLNLNGATNGTGNATDAEIANGGQLYAYNPGGWYVWNGSWVWVMDAPITPEKPGPSVQLFNNPYYTCATNYYVAATGNDSNNGTSPSTPWLTLQRANNSLPTGGKAAGSCVNVAPGTYAQGVSITAGGNLASSTGYVVYRCTTMDACLITDPNSAFAAGYNESSAWPNYLIFDGFTLSASSVVGYANGIVCSNHNSGITAAGCHHWMILNNIINGYGQGGVGLNDSEFFYTSHNAIYNNAHQCNGIYGSGIGYVSLKVVSGYTKTADDTNSNNVASLNLLGVQGASFPFNNVVAWNVVYNNWQGCGPPPSSGYTDGNGIIMNSFGTQNGNPVSYLNQTLVAFNVTYNNGGGGVHIFASENVTVANNSCYNNNIDPNGVGSGGPCIDTNQSYSNTIINNVAVAIPAAPGTGGCTAMTVPFQRFNSAILGGPPSGQPADQFGNNITQLQGGHNSCWGILSSADPPTGENPMFNADVGQYSCSSNKCATDPLWVSAGNSSTGNENTQPSGANFAPQAGSPAIGYGLTKTYLPAQSTDAGACYHTLASCP